MPVKQVRFSGADVLYSPEPATPSPSFSDSSLPSSSGPVTPPSPYGYNLPHPYPSYPPFYKPFRTEPPVMSLRINRMLEVSQHPEILWDISRTPASATTLRRLVFSAQAFSEPATVPPVPHLTITSPHLPWSIPVMASRGYVSISDVLATLYQSLRINITDRDYHSLPSHSAQRRVRTAYEDRYRRIRDPRDYAEEKRNGVKRIDFLMGHTRFMGLTSSRSVPNVWELHVS
jgi:hypothetical protein